MRLDSADLRFLGLNRCSLPDAIRHGAGNGRDAPSSGGFLFPVSIDFLSRQVHEQASLKIAQARRLGCESMSQAGAMPSAIISFILSKKRKLGAVDNRRID